jgi:glycerophosphoryl diester phosphodiesterase
MGQGILIFIFILLLTPFLSAIYRLALSVTGYSYVTINNIGLFLINPIVLLFLLLVFIVIGISFLWEACYLITFYTLIEHGGKPSLIKVLILSLKKLVLIFLRRNFSLLPMVWLIIGVSNIPLFIFAVKRVRMLSFIADNLMDMTFTIPVAVIITVCMVVLMIRRLFIFLYSLIEGKTYVKTSKINKNNLGDSIEQVDLNESEEQGTTQRHPGLRKDKSSKYRNRNKLKTVIFQTAVIGDEYIKRISFTRTFFYFIIWNIGIGLADLALYILTMAVTALFITGIPDKSLAIATFLTINDKMNGYFFIGIFIINTLANFALYTHLFFQYKLEQNENVDIDHTVDNIFIQVGAYKTVIKIALILLACFNFYSFYDIVRNGSPLAYMNLDMIHVTSHRGFSAGVPENTLPAIEKAIEEQADFVEVDVRMTKDGELVLLHDENVLRTTGVNKKIWQLNLSEVSRLDAGKWKDKAYTGTRIPTLREVFELCKGKVNLNLDLKYRNEGEGLEEKVAALIEEYEMQWQCVISSTSLTALEHIKKLNPDIRTGYITYQIYRGYLTNDNIDFFSVRSNLITKTVSSEIHKAGKEIHVWTVNNRSELERMKLLGVDNIITDDPSYAKEVLYQEDSGRFFLTLAKIVIE